MKKVILSTTCFAFMGLGFISCEKEQLKANNEQNNAGIDIYKSNKSELTKSQVYELVSPNEVKDGPRTTRRREWWESRWVDESWAEEGKHFGCRGVGGGCTPDVTVSPGLRTIIMDIGNTSVNGSLTDLQNKFIENREDLEEVIDVEHINGFLAGAFNFRVRGLNGETIFLIFSNNPDNHVQAVYPIK